MTKPIYTPSSADINSAPALFVYEMRMFRGTTDALLLRGPACDDWVLSRALLDLALVHARNLLDFFVSAASPNDDVLACHVLNDYTSPSAILEHLASCRNDINKTLSHLTYSRVARKRSWPFRRFRRDLETAYAKFLALLPESERAEWQAQQAFPACSEPATRAPRG